VTEKALKSSESITESAGKTSGMSLGRLSHLTSLRGLWSAFAYTDRDFIIII
jgi:hypothetical protein